LDRTVRVGQLAAQGCNSKRKESRSKGGAHTHSLYPFTVFQVAKIESERLLGELVARELQARATAGQYDGRFAVQYHYFGYEGRCPPPTDFDSNYCYGLGLTAGALIASGSTGVMACLKGLTKPATEWTAHGVPLTAMLAVERRKGKDKPVIRKALVELGGAPFAALVERRAGWRLAEAFVQPGPVQYDGARAGGERVAGVGRGGVS
jgi:pyrophosphate--fructose-6-phosphate 1-phosphotransferase